MPKIEAGLQTGQFLLDGLPYQSGNFDPEYVPGGIPKFGIRRAGTPAKDLDYLYKPIPVSEWLDDTDTPFVDLAAIATYLQTFFFRNVGLPDAGSTPYSGVYDNYGDLIANETAGTQGRLFYIEASQGTRWLPITLGGTYYPAGAYLDTGSAFISDRNNIAAQLQELLDVTTQSGDIKTVTSDYTILPTDKVVLVDTALGDVNVTLPLIGSSENVGVTIKKIDTSTNSIAINTPNTETIDGLNSRDISTYLQSRDISSDGTNYLQVGGHTPNIENRIIVKRAEQLAGTLDSSKVYYIDGLIDMGSIEITAPAGGLFLTGVDYFKSGLYSTEDNHTLFKTAVGVPTSNMRIQELNFWSSGVASKLFDVDGTGNFGAIEFNSCNLGDFTGQTTEIGEMTGFRQFRTNDSGFFRVADGLTFNGTWSGGFRIGDSIALSTVGTMTLFKEGTSLVFQGRCISDINAASINTTTTVFGFQESNFSLDGGCQLEEAAFNPDAVNAVTLSETSTKAFFRDCTGIRNTRAGFQTDWTTDVVTPLTLDTPVKALGATVTINNTWFTQTGNNEVTYNSSLVKDLSINVNITIGGGPNDEINLIVRRWDNSSLSYEDVKSKIRAINNLQGGNDVVTFSFKTRVDDISINDRIEIWLENTSDNSDVTVLSGSELIAEVI